MFDLSNPQQRERLLVALAGVALCAIIMVIVPAQYRETTRLKIERDKLVKDIDEHERHAKNKDEIQSRLSSMENQALTSLGTALQNEALSKYQNWLRGLMESADFRSISTTTPVNSGTVKGGYRKHTFSVTGEGRLEQIAEFLRRFRRAEYLHQIQSFGPRPIANQPGMFKVTFRVEALSLPQVAFVNVPNIDEIPPMTDGEQQMLADIRERAILSAYTPPRPVAERQAPPPPFDSVPYCFVVGIVEVDGKPQCWIDHRTTGRKYYLFEGGTFMLGDVNCTIKKIEVKADRVQIAAAGEIRAIRVGKSFEQYDDPGYFLTNIVGENDELRTEDSAGEPYCIIVHGSETEDGEIIEKEQYILSVGEAFPMALVSCTVREIEPTNNRIQIEAAGVFYTIRIGASFSEFSD